MPGVIIAVDVVIKDSCILNTKAIVGGGSKLSSYSSLGPGANLEANVKVGDCSAISLGAKVMSGIEIGADSVIGAGALVIENVGNCKMVYGIPAKVIKDRKAGDFYLTGNKEKENK